MTKTADKPPFIREADNVRNLNFDFRNNLNTLAQILAKLSGEPLDSYIIAVSHMGNIGVSIDGGSKWYQILNHEFGPS
jgi:hypothetical protein